MANNIKWYLERSGKSQKDFCRDLGFRETTVSDWLNAKTYPRIDKIEKLANYFGIEKADLVESHAYAKSGIPVYRIPIVGKVVAGTPIDAIENITDYIRVTNPAAADGSYYALHVTGASMEPEMREGDLVCVHKQDYFDRGDICIVLVNGNEATVKKVLKSDQGITLIGFNATVYPQHFYNARQVEISIFIKIFCTKKSGCIAASARSFACLVMPIQVNINISIPSRFQETYN